MSDVGCQMSDKNPLIVALDVSAKEEAIHLCHDLKDKVDIFKVGLELFLSQGRGIVDIINAFGKRVFLDLKLLDIPNQAKGACEQIVKMGVWMFTVHISGGTEMLEGVVRKTAEVAESEKLERPKVLGVTVLTSFNQSGIKEIGINKEVKEQVIDLARLGLEAGLDGVVASPQEAELIRKDVGDDFLIVAPGIRPRGEELGDQKRTLTPSQALERGASYIVVGRPVTEASNPVQVVEEILQEIGGKT